MNPDTRYTDAVTERCRAVTGQYPADLVGIVAECADALGELEQVLRAITQASATPTANPRLALAHIHGLAGAGFRVASDLANYADCQADDLAAHLETRA